MKSDSQILTEFYRAFDPAKPLGHGDPRYFPLDDPVDGGEAVRGTPSVRTLLRRSIEVADDATVQLMSGFRGSGKTTELLNLAGELKREGYHVVVGNAREYLTLSQPLDLPSLLLAIAGVFATATRNVERDLSAPFLGALKHLVGEAEIDLDSLQFKVPGFEGKLQLEPTFRQKLHRALELRQAAFITEFRKFVGGCVEALRESSDSRGVVLIFDSLEHLEGPASEARKVFESVEVIFSQFVDALKLPGCHVVYSVPPYLRILVPAAAADFGGGAIRVLPMTRLWRNDATRTVDRDGVSALTRLIEKRYNWRKVLGERPETLERIIRASGGYLRDLFRILQEASLVADALPLTDAQVEQGLQAVTRSYMTLPEADLDWLGRVMETRELCLPDVQDLSRHARLFESHLVLCYRNGDEWYDVHPLVRGQLEARSATDED